MMGRIVGGGGVQVVFLTATLAPADVGMLYSRMGLNGRRVRLFRERTTRRNIGYYVRTIRGGPDAEDEAVYDTVRAGLARYEQGKVIVYSGQIERAERLA